ncbi:MAG: 50S ribosomal protein L24 [Clostridiales bacterium]|nr:50S ribosomal protein L24 [Clostridiales bacterium]
MANKLHVKTDDNVVVITGKERGRKGKVIKAIPSEGKVVVAEINMIKKHQKAQGQNKPASIIEREAAIDASNVMLVCPKCGEPTRTSTKINKDKTKVRVCKKCGASIDKTKKTSGKGE